MPEIDTDFLVVGAGASGMAFTDALIASADVDVVMVDRRHRPGGHWNDDYPFVRLHQPSALYGVASRPLGQDRIDESGMNAGFYDRKTGRFVYVYYTATTPTPDSDRADDAPMEEISFAFGDLKVDYLGNSTGSADSGHAGGGGHGAGKASFSNATRTAHWR